MNPLILIGAGLITLGFMTDKKPTTPLKKPDTEKKPPVEVKQKPEVDEK